MRCTGLGDRLTGWRGNTDDRFGGELTGVGMSLITGTLATFGGGDLRSFCQEIGTPRSALCTSTDSSIATDPPRITCSIISFQNNPASQILDCLKFN